MAISRSTERDACFATVSIYSGRKNPTWEVSLKTAQRLGEIWMGLEPLDEAPPQAPPLGYRGTVLDCGSRGAWVACRGVIESGDIRKSDPGRTFERLLLESAPEGMIPRSVIHEILG
jgi:hypothetical protein